MNFIAQRPEHWNAVVGQERALRLIKAILTTNRFMPRGYLFDGSIGVGKTTTAYLLSRALMCTGPDPMGCGLCPSCTFIDKAKNIEKGLNECPDFLEIDAASNSGVENARNLMDIMNSPPSAMAARRIMIIDEAHQLTTEAWDVYLKPLETRDTSSIFIYVSNQPGSIPASIASRLTSIHFERVHVDLIFGLLANLASANQIQYEHDALRFIAVKSKGLVRDAVKWLGTVASMGTLTLELVKDALHDVLEEVCIKCFLAITKKQQAEASKWIDEAARNYPPSRVIECMFSIYAQTPWAEPGTVYAQIGSRMPNVSVVDSIFIKWLSNTNLPADVLPLIVYELLHTIESPTSHSTPSVVPLYTSSGKKMYQPVGPILPNDDIENLLND